MTGMVLTTCGRTRREFAASGEDLARETPAGAIGKFALTGHAENLVETQLQLGGVADGWIVQQQDFDQAVDAGKAQAPNRPRQSLPTLVAGMGSYTHYAWGDRLGLTGIYSILQLANLQAGTDTTLRRSQYVGGVVQYFPNKRFMTGIEYLFGQRENRNGDTGSDNRVQVSTLVKF
jgi:hypothetical protein